MLVHIFWCLDLIYSTECNGNYARWLWLREHNPPTLKSQTPWPCYHLCISFVHNDACTFLPPPQQLSLCISANVIIPELPKYFINIPKGVMNALMRRVWDNHEKEGTQEWDWTWSGSPSISSLVKLWPLWYDRHITITITTMLWRFGVSKVGSVHPWHKPQVGHKMYKYRVQVKCEI